MRDTRRHSLVIAALMLLLGAVGVGVHTPPEVPAEPGPEVRPPSAARPTEADLLIAQFDGHAIVVCDVSQLFTDGPLWVPPTQRDLAVGDRPDDRKVLVQGGQVWFVVDPGPGATFLRRWGDARSFVSWPDVPVGGEVACDALLEAIPMVTIRGVVVDDATSKPVANVNVRGCGDVDGTDAQGSYVLAAEAISCALSAYRAADGKIISTAKVWVRPLPGKDLVDLELRLLPFKPRNRPESMTERVAEIEQTVQGLIERKRAELLAFDQFVDDQVVSTETRQLLRAEQERRATELRELETPFPNLWETLRSAPRDY